MRKRLSRGFGCAQGNTPTPCSSHPCRFQNTPKLISLYTICMRYRKQYTKRDPFTYLREKVHF